MDIVFLCNEGYFKTSLAKIHLLRMWELGNGGNAAPIARKVFCSRKKQIAETPEFHIFAQEKINVSRLPEDVKVGRRPIGCNCVGLVSQSLRYVAQLKRQQEPLSHKALQHGQVLPPAPLKIQQATLNRSRPWLQAWCAFVSLFSKDPNSYARISRNKLPLRTGIKIQPKIPTLVPME
jgi:hypothetical protein